jgi:hypothetical protein
MSGAKTTKDSFGIVGIAIDHVEPVPIAARSRPLPSG